MRRSLIILAVLLLIGSLCRADGTMINSFKYATSGTGLCSSCTPGDPSDVFCEDFEGSTDCGNDSGNAQNCQCEWAVTADGTGSVSFTSTRNQTSNPCANKGTYNVDLNVSGTYGSWANDYEIHRTFTAKTTVYLQAYIYIESEGIGNNETVPLFALYSSGDSTDAMDIVLRQVSGSLYLATYANNQGTGPGVGGTALSTGTWYRLGIEYVANTVNGGKIYINGVEDTNCRINTPNTSVASLYILAAAGKYRWQLDNFQIDDDTMPEACAQ